MSEEMTLTEVAERVPCRDQRGHEWEQFYVTKHYGHHRCRRCPLHHAVLREGITL